MKKTLLPVIILVLVFCFAGCNAKITSTPAVSEGSDYDVLYFNWGMSRDDIIGIEKREADNIRLDAYHYENKELNGLLCSLTYGFDENGLSYFLCYFDESCSTTDNYNVIKAYIEKNVRNLSVHTSVELDDVHVISWVNDRSIIELSWTKNISWTKDKDYSNSLTLDAYRL